MLKPSRTALVALLLTPTLAMPSAAIAETRVSFASGVDYSSGDYGGTQDTEVVRVPLIAQIDTDNWQFRASIPYLSVTGPADIADEEGGTTTRTDTETGFGDTTLEVTRSFEDLGDTDVYVDVSGWVRLPTGDENTGLGNGATDYAVIGELGNDGDNGGVFISGGRRFLGDRDDGSVREDGWQARLGGWLNTGERTRVGAFYTWREASRAGREDPSEVGAYVSYGLSDQLRVSVSGGAGLSDASADYRAGVRLTWRSGASELRSDR